MRRTLIASIVWMLLCLTSVASAESFSLVGSSGNPPALLELYLWPGGCTGHDDDQYGYGYGYGQPTMAWVEDDGPWTILSDPWGLPRCFVGSYYKAPQYNGNILFYWETDTPVRLSVTPSWTAGWSTVLTPGWGFFWLGVPSGTGTWDNRFSVTVSAVPEPSGIIALLGGLMSAGITAWLRRESVAPVYRARDDLFLGG
jgi:hypothetical protein